MKYFPLISIIVLVSIVIGHSTLAYGQESKDASVCTDIIIKDSKASLTDRIEGYYSAAQCYQKIGRENYDPEAKLFYEAELAFAKAEILGRELSGNATALKARQELERLYKVLHNNTLIGIEKIYRKAEESLAES